MSEFIKLTSPRGAALVRRDDVRSVDHNGTTATVYMATGFLPDVTNPLPALEAALGYCEHPAVADLARHKCHLDNIRCDLADAGVAIPADDDPELTPREMVKALIAEVVALRGQATSTEAAAPAFVPAKVGDRWGDLTEAQIRALPEGTEVESTHGRKTLKGEKWRYDSGTIAGDRDTPNDLVPENVITHIPAPGAAGGGGGGVAHQRS